MCVARKLGGPQGGGATGVEKGSRKLEKLEWEVARRVGLEGGPLSTPS